MKSFPLLIALIVTCSVADSADSPVLHLTNGGFVPGQLQKSASPEVVRWQGTSFTQPFDFSRHAVSAVHYPRLAEPPKPVGEYCFELAAGDVLFGDLINLTNDEAELDVARLGHVHVKRDHIRRMYRWGSGADLVYLGPNGLVGWKEPAAVKQWHDEGGQPQTDKEGSFIRGDFGIPAQAVIEFELFWKNKPDFVLAFGVEDNDDETAFKRSYRFEVWDNELVLRCELGREADVDTVQSIAAGSGRVHLVAYLDQEKGRMLVYSPNGKPLSEISVKPRKPIAHPGIRLTNRKGDVRLERLRITRWDGVTPREVQPDKVRLHRTDGSIVYGQVTGFDAKSKQFTVTEEKQETKFDAAQLASAFLSPPGDDKPRAFRVVYQDGTRLSGELNEFGDDYLQLTTLSITEPLKLPVASLQSLVVLTHDSDKSVETPEGRSGKLQTSNLFLHGRLTSGRETPDASCLVWHPDNSATASPLRVGTSGRIVYREPLPPQPKPTPQQVQAQQMQQQGGGFANAFLKALANGPVQPAAGGGRRLMHLRSGDTIPCDVKQINEEGIVFKTTMSEATFVGHEKVKAVELLSGLSAPKLNKLKQQRLLTLPRMQKDSPPTHLIRSKDGDFLRGRILDMDDKRLSVEIRLEAKEIPRDRIAQIIWLHPDEMKEATEAATSEQGGAGLPVKSSDTPADGSSKPAVQVSAPEDRESDAAQLAKTEEKSRPKNSEATRVQALRSDGIRLTFLADVLENKTLSGKSDVLGACRTELVQVDQLLIGNEIEKAAASLAYHKWKLHHATEPKIAQDVDGQSPDGRAPGLDSPLVGKAAPDFELPLLGGNGKKFHLAESKGHIVVLDFWATWCGPCLQTMPLVEKVIDDFADQGVQLVGVNLEEQAKQITSTLERHKMHLTVAMDQDGVVAGKYEASAIPQTVVIDREGKIVRLFVGGGPHLAEQLREVLRELLGTAKTTE